MIEVSCNDLIRQQSINSPNDLSIGIRTELWSNILGTARKYFNEIYVFSGYPKNESTMAQTRTPDWNVWYVNTDIEVWNNRAKELCDEHKIPFIDLYTGLSQTNYADTWADAIHPDSAGHEMIAAIAHKKLKALGF
jgi:lysophospholipase L1-like esterase